jgi:hypothetical protein
VWDIALRILEVVGYIGGALAAIFAGHLWVQAQKRQSIAAAKDELIQVQKENSDAWKSRYESEHLEYNTYREKQHAQNNDSGALILKLTNENADLKGKTDLSPVMKVMTDFIENQRAFMTEQTAINSKILSALVNLEQRINGKHSRRPNYQPKQAERSGP